MKNINLRINQKGITVTSLTIYVIVATIVVTILVFLNANFFSNINDLTEKSSIISENLNFKSAFLRDIKSENDIKVIDYNDNMIRLSNNVKYEIRILDKDEKIDANKKYAVYRNDTQVAKSIVQHTEIINEKEIKRGPYFEYDVNKNTVKVGIKFSDGKNVFLEDGTYIVGKEVNISWENSKPNLYIPPTSGDAPEVDPDIPEEDRIYAYLDKYGTLKIGSTYDADDAREAMIDYREVSETIVNGNPMWSNNSENIINVEFLEPVNLSSLENLFANCSNLVEIQNIEYMLVDEATTAEGAFQGCSSLMSVDMSDWNTSSITNMSNMFNGCSNLNLLNLNAIDTSAVTTMAGMLQDCSDLVDLSIDAISTDSLTDMSDMFNGCSSLLSLKLNRFNTKQVTDMSRMFANCNNIVNIENDKWETDGLQAIDEMFYNCKRLVSTSLANFNLTNVTSFANLFKNCSGLLTVDLKGVDTSSVTDMSNMFAGCMKLEEIVQLTSLDTSKVTDMSGMFKDCSAIKSLEFGEDSIFTTEEVTDMSEMFKGCGSLKQLILEAFDTANVTNMTSMFEACGNLTELDLQNFNTDKVENMSRLFMNASKLSQILVNDAWNSNNAITDNMFDGCGVSSVDEV